MTQKTDFISAKDFNNLTQSLERNLFHFDPKFLDDDNFLELEAIELGVNYDSDDSCENYFIEEFQDQYQGFQIFNESITDEDLIYLKEYAKEHAI